MNFRTNLKRLAIGLAAAGCLDVLFQNCSGFSGALGTGQSALSSTVSTPNQGQTPSPQPPPSAMLSSCSVGYKLQSGACIACTEPRHYQYSVPANTELLCSPSETALISVQVPDTGYALARAALAFSNSGPQAYYWNAQVLVGTEKVYTAVGDDICSGSTAMGKTALGYGLLSAANSTVTVQAYQGSDPCVNGEVSVLAGGLLDVWVEDPAPECAQQDINLVASYDTVTGPSSPAIAAVYPASSFTYYGWANSMSALVDLAVPATPNRSQIMILGNADATSMNESGSSGPACGANTAALISQVATNNLGIVNQVENSIPAIGGPGGMGHLVLSPQTPSPVAYDPKALNLLELLVGSNLSPDIYVTSGGCCGDGKIGFVKFK